ncbi:hypothetical protein FRC12_012345 [Ceratobasidium sp. 428]|nr:hypothetical protein FRC12_012345 [Ceratobasidium sp. 428]
MDFVHVRWLYYDYDQPGGLDTCRLDWLTYETGHEDQDMLDLFDFVDPGDIIRASHLIPDFESDKESEWNSYHVSRFVDRDMLMRYIGGGVGHCWHADELTEPVSESNETPVTNVPVEGEAEDSEPEGDDDAEPANDPEIEAEGNLDTIDELPHGEELEEPEEELEEQEEDEELEEDAFESDPDEGAENDGNEEWDDLFGF